MIIELRGLDFVNKGGELMLYAIQSKIKKVIPGALFVATKTKYCPRNKQLEFGIYTKTNFTKYKIPFKHIFACIPLFLRRRWHYINDNEINVVVDASGFAFGDVWGVKKASKKLGDHVAKWNKEGKKIILMPQAFGTFYIPQLITVMKTIVKHADLIFVRDELSLTHLEQLDGQNKKFILAPDFTNLIEGKVPSNFDFSAHEVAIIVNYKMIETATGIAGEAYVNLIYRMVIMIQNLGYKPYFLIHEGRMDRKLADMINKRLPNNLPLVEEDNALYLKGIILVSKAVITARFHGLVSCLSQGVPCLTSGWSHKYEMLLKDYNYAEGMVDINCNDQLLLAKVESVLTGPSALLIHKKLIFAAAKQKQRSEEMWEKFFRTMDKNKYKKINYSTLPHPQHQAIVSEL